MRVRTSPEKIVRLELLGNAFNGLPLSDAKMRRLVELACGHVAFSAALDRVVCPRCSEMLRRSIEGLGEDWDAFRHHGAKDQMVWRDDPCRSHNEPTDLAGNFLND